MTATLVESASRLGDALSVRELQVVSLVGDGLTNAEIGRELWLSARTVQTHLRRAGAKLGTGDRAGIVGATFASGQLRVVRRGDVELEPRLAAALVRAGCGMSNPEIARE